MKIRLHLKNNLRKYENSENLQKSSKDFAYEKLIMTSIPCLYKRFSPNKKRFFSFKLTKMY